MPRGFHKRPVPGREGTAALFASAARAAGPLCLRRSPLAAVKMGGSPLGGVRRLGAGGGSASPSSSPELRKARCLFVISHLGLVVSLGLVQAVVLNRGVVGVARVILGAVGEEKGLHLLTSKKTPSARCVSSACSLLTNVTRMNGTRGPTPANGASGTRLMGSPLRGQSGAITAWWSCARGLPRLLFSFNRAIHRMKDATFLLHEHLFLS